MTVSSTAASVVGQGNGVTTAFPFNFLIPTSSDVQIIYTDASGNQSQLNSAQYTISGIGSSSGGTVTYPLSGSPIAAGTSITISRVLTVTQPTSLRNQGGYFPETVEAAFDRVVMLIQQIAAGLGGAARAVLFPLSDVNPTQTLPPAAARANKYFAFDSSGNPLALPGTSSNPDLSANTALATSSTTARSLAARFADVANVKDFGAKGDGVTDDSAAIQAAINAVATIGGTVVLPPPSVGYAIASTLNFTARSRVRFVGCASQGDLHGVQIIWNGVNGGTAILLDRTRDSYFSDFSVVPGNGTLGIGIRIDNVSSPSGATNSTNNIFERIAINTSTTGVQIGNSSTSNNDLHTFRDVYIDGPGTYGYFINDGQSKYIKIVGGSIGSRTYGIATAAGSYTAHMVNFSGNTTDNYLGLPTDAISIISCQSESAQKFLDDTGLSGASFAVTIMGCRCDPLLVGSDKIYLRHKKRGPLNLIGNDFASGLNYPNTRFVVQSTSPGAACSAVGNVFPNNTPFNVANFASCITQHSNNYVGAGNAQFSLDEENSIAQITATQNDYAPSQARIWLLTSDVSRNITGIGDPWAGRDLTIMNVGANPIVLQNNNAGSAAAHYITTGTGADFTLAANKTVRLCYDGLTLVWRIVGTSP